MALRHMRMSLLRKIFSAFWAGNVIIFKLMDSFVHRLLLKEERNVGKTKSATSNREICRVPVAVENSIIDEMLRFAHSVKYDVCHQIVRWCQGMRGYEYSATGAVNMSQCIICEIEWRES